MTEPLARRSPSDILSELQGQLSRELSRLNEGRREEPWLFRAYVQHAQVLAWRGVAEGRMAAPQEVMECLDAVHSFVDRHLPDLSDPATAAAVEIHYATQSLHLAGQALEARRVEDRLSDRRSEIERAILQVLAENRGRYLRRGEIHESLKLPEPPTPARVGQLLVELHSENVVVRIHGRAQGNPNAAFYALSPRGLELCMSMDLIKDVKENASLNLSLLDQALSTLLDSAVPNDYRSILAGLIASLEPIQHVQDLLSYWIDRSQVDIHGNQLIQTIKSAWHYRSQGSNILHQPTTGSELLCATMIRTVVENCQAWKSKHDVNEHHGRPS